MVLPSRDIVIAPLNLDISVEEVLPLMRSLSMFLGLVPALTLSNCVPDKFQQGIARRVPQYINDAVLVQYLV